MIKKFEPKDNLKEWVDYVWLVYEEHLSDSARNDIVVPLCHFNLVFNLKDDYFLEENNKIYKMPEVVRVGVLDQAVKIKYGESVFQIGIALKPSEITSLIFRSEKNIANKVFSDYDLSHKIYEVSPNFYDLYDKLGSIEIDENQFDENFDAIMKLIWTYLEHSMDEVLIKKDTKDERVHDKVHISQMVQYIDEHLDSFKVTQMAQYFHVSVNTLERRFKKEVGLMPKSFANIKRFLIQNKIQWAGEETLDYYYDQAHLIKDTRKYTNKTPKHLNEDQKELTLGYIFSHLNRKD
ncbi:hypothetical protein QE109_11380 [Fusibacter bizertensis]|uniref:HTH araC/xylS-type domain-containing protein n=1 Tax=Fusibacter bizertensis TaxID=1488331 RepID=A0ABT6NEA2_9FIRM|nr:DUF6597 domain-containing transcriptional factor [Fusibacter bizertensis]MDH8678754.1 hypothetical protein [Fusibacter bizertensis]